MSVYLFFYSKKMQTQTIKKPTCIVDFNNEQEIDEALMDINFKNSNFITFEESYKKSISNIESLTI